MSINITNIKPLDGATIECSEFKCIYKKNNFVLTCDYSNNYMFFNSEDNDLYSFPNNFSFEIDITTDKIFQDILNEKEISDLKELDIAEKEELNDFIKKDMKTLTFNATSDDIGFYWYDILNLDLNKLSKNVKNYILSYLETIVEIQTPIYDIFAKELTIYLGNHIYPTNRKRPYMSEDI